MNSYRTTSHSASVLGALVVTAGLAAAQDGRGTDAVATMQASSSHINHAGHLYFNLATGERLLTSADRADALLRDGSGSDEIWVIGGSAPCADPADTTAFYYALDSEDDTSEHNFFYSRVLIEWGDIQMNTVVDCVQVHWLTNHADTDTNSDGFGDGVEGLAATWTFWDGMNGRSPQMESIALPIIEFSFFSLPGELSDPNDSAIAFYTADIDLGGSFANSLVFEIGDTDSDLQGASVHNARMDLRDADGDLIPDIDPDQDGKADWGWSIDFTQPGTLDVDNADSDNNPMTGIDGDLSARATAGVALGLPSPGHSEFDSVSGEWEWVLDGSTAGMTEDLITVIFDGVISGPGNFGGFSCDPYVPYADIAIVLYGPGDEPNPCPADLNGDGELDFIDISSFIETPRDFNGDTQFDYLDISIFVQYLMNGC